MAKLTVKEVSQPHPKIWEAVVTGGGKIKWWAGDTAYTEQLQPGAEVDVEVEKKDGKYGEERWVKSVNGQTAKAQNRGGGGGGGFKGQPKDDKAIVAQVIIKEACETARANALSRGKLLEMTEVSVIADGLVSVYQKVYRALKDGAK